MSFPCATAMVILACIGVPTLAAQTRPCEASIRPLQLVADVDERLRFLRSTTPGHEDLLRDVAQCARDSVVVARPFLHARALYPSIITVWNSALPDTRGNGSLWAGRGLSAIVSGGALIDLGRWHAVIDPEYQAAENRAFELQLSPNPNRSSYASPFYSGAVSLDFPTRPGEGPTSQVGFGASALFLDVGGTAMGVSASPQQWGPGLDGLVLGRNASGVLRAFVRTVAPVETRSGRFSGTWFVGEASESPYFDRDPTNDARTLAAAAVAWSPPQSNAWALGAAHAIMRPGAPLSNIGTAVIDAWRPISSTEGDELTSVFARARIPDGRLRMWLELAHQGSLRTRELLTAPLANLGYRMGVEHASERRSGAWVTLVEVANLEQSQDILGRPVHDFYSGYGTTQGWTEHGQLLGDGIGPGGQSQFLSLDWATPAWHLGGYAERVRWNEDELFREYLPTPARHDVSLRGGLRAATDYRGYRVSIDVSNGRRLNYLFQNLSFLPNYRTVDIPFREIKLTMIPRLAFLP